MRNALISIRWLVFAIFSCIASLGIIYGSFSSVWLLNSRAKIVESSIKSYQSGASNGRLSREISDSLIQGARIELETLNGFGEVHKGTMIAGVINLAVSLAFFSLTLKLRRRTENPAHTSAE